MTRLLRIGSLAGAALTGAAGAGLSAPAPHPPAVRDRAVWGTPIGLKAIRPHGLIWSTRGETGMLSGTTALTRLTTRPSAECPAAVRRHVALVVPIGDPLALAQRGARATLRYHIVRAHGWVNAGLRVYANRSVHADEMLASSRQEAALVVPIAADMLARDRAVTLDILLRACTRLGGRGTVSLDTIEVAAR